MLSVYVFPGLEFVVNFQNRSLFIATCMSVLEAPYFYWYTLSFGLLISMVECV